MIAPAFVQTKAHDWPPQEVRAAMLTPEDVARFVRFAVEQRPHSAIFEIDLGSPPV